MSSPSRQSYFVRVTTDPDSDVHKGGDVEDASSEHSSHRCSWIGICGAPFFEAKGQGPETSWNAINIAHVVYTHRNTTNSKSRRFVYHLYVSFSYSIDLADANTHGYCSLRCADVLLQQCDSKGLLTHISSNISASEPHKR